MARRLTLALSMVALMAAALSVSAVSHAGPLLGLRGGMSFSPDQVVLGAHLKMPQIA